jgi:hypothetical protein
MNPSPRVLTLVIPRNPSERQRISANPTNAGDMKEPGKADTISITIWNKSGGLWFASNWDGTKTIEELLGGGNLVVR